MQDITVKSSQHSYSVKFLSDRDALLSALAHHKNPLAILDSQVAELHPDFAAQLKQRMPVMSFQANEENKTLAGLETVLSFIQSQQATKNFTLIGIGGGIVNDVAGLAAHLYYRGIAFIGVPTTLLAMCDSCIGGKTGVNFNGFKNQLGAIHAPSAVYIWTGFLETLSNAAMQSGCGELLKAALLDGQESYQGFKDFIQRKHFTNPTLCQYIVVSLMTKKRLIELDEYDTGVRYLLNYGHTFGHALELASAYAIPHGVAVASGMDVANYIAYRKGLLSKAIFEDVNQVIQENFNVDLKATVTPEAWVQYTVRDKKLTETGLNMVLMECPGQLRIAPVALDSELTRWVSEYVDLV